VLDILSNLNQLVQRNDEDLLDLHQRIQRQRDFFQKQVDDFSGPGNDEIKFDNSEMIALFKRYIEFVLFSSAYGLANKHLRNLKDLCDKLDTLINVNYGSKTKILKKLLTASSTRQDIAGLSQRLTDSFEEFRVSHGNSV
jgi:hypothetical protein